LEILLLLLVCFLFWRAYIEDSKRSICSAGSSKQDAECVITKDGSQICGHTDIRQLCEQVEIGFYVTFLGAVLIAGAQVLFITSVLLRRSQIVEENNRYSRLHTELMED